MEEDEAARLTDKVLELGDVELAALLCFVAEEHCIVEAETAELNNVEKELRLVGHPLLSISLAYVLTDLRQHVRPVVCRAGLLQRDNVGRFWLWNLG